MSQPAGLSFDQAPPIGVPLRFFLSAPLFAAAAALLLLWQGPALLASRWSPAMLGAVHLITLGHMGMAMMGAMLQMLPVAAGTPVFRPRLVAGMIHALSASGILLFSLGMAFSQPLALKLALPLLGAALFPFILIILLTLRRARPENMSARAMRLAILMLLATATLGLILLSNHGFGWWLKNRESLTNLHLTWGLLGWAGLLVAGISWQVVPMFQLTPPYPARFTRHLPPLLFAALLALAPAAMFAPSWRYLPGGVLAAGFTSYALTTLWLQHKRRRKLPDVTLDFWRGSMLSLLLAILLWTGGQFMPALPEAYGMLLGALLIVGFALSAINGMLYKIVPFLTWFHLQSRRGPGGPAVPNVKLILPERRMRRQMWLHFAALAALLAAILKPTFFAYPAALLFGASSLWLWWNLLSAWRTYRTVNAQIARARAGSQIPT